MMNNNNNNNNNNNEDDDDDDDDGGGDDDNNSNNNNNNNNNKLFRTDCKKFYNRLRQTYPNVQNAPDKEEVENFWRKTHGKKFQHNGEACWIKDQ
jgi:hypothetical protein